MYMSLSPPVLGLVTTRNKNKSEQVGGNNKYNIQEASPEFTTSNFFFFFFCLSITYNVQQMVKGNLEFEFLQLINKMALGV